MVLTTLRSTPYNLVSYLAAYIALYFPRLSFSNTVLSMFPLTKTLSPFLSMQSICYPFLFDEQIPIFPDRRRSVQNRLEVRRKCDFISCYNFFALISSAPGVTPSSFVLPTLKALCYDKRPESLHTNPFLLIPVQRFSTKCAFTQGTFLLYPFCSIDFKHLRICFLDWY